MSIIIIISCDFFSLRKANSEKTTMNDVDLLSSRKIT